VDTVTLFELLLVLCSDEMGSFATARVIMLAANSVNI
jgi:hypothetical protein